MNLRSALGILLLFCTVIPLISPILATATDVIDVRYFKSPVFNGAVADSEYPPAVLLSTSAKIYMSYDDSIYYIAAHVTDGTDDGVNDKLQMYIDPYNAKGQAPGMPHSMIEVARDGTYRYYWYSGGWAEDPSGWPFTITALVVSGVNSWSAEIKMGLRAPTIDIIPGTNRSLGFLCRVYDKTTLLLGAPSGADPVVPATWGTMRSSSWWGPVDLAMVGVTYNPPVIVGKSTKITVVFQNTGPSPISNVQVDLTINGAPVTPKQFLGTLAAGQTGTVQFDWVAGEGSFRFVATVSITGGIYEKNTANNVGEKTVTPDWLILSVLVPSGISVTVGTRTSESTGSPLSFTLPWGVVAVSVARVVESPGTRMVFKAWRPSVSTNPSFSYNLTSSATLEATYDVFYLCVFNFKDKANRALQGLSFRVKFPNTTAGQFISPGNVWMPVGTSSLIGVYVGGMNVLENNQTVSVEAPIELTYYVNLRDITLRVKDVLSLPVAGATLAITFLNGTTITLTTPSDGIVTIAKVPLGRLNATAEFLSYATRVQVDASVQQEWPVTLALSYGVLALVGAVVGTAILVIVALLIRARLKR